MIRSMLCPIDIAGFITFLRRIQGREIRDLKSGAYALLSPEEDKMLLDPDRIVPYVKNPKTFKKIKKQYPRCLWLAIQSL